EVLMASIAALLLLLSIGSSVAAIRMGRQRDAIRGNLVRAELAEQTAENANEAKTLQLGEALFEQARASRQSSEAGRRFKSLEVLTAAAKIGPNLKMRNEAIACMALTDLGNARELSSKLHKDFVVAFDTRQDHY